MSELSYTLSLFRRDQESSWYVCATIHSPQRCQFQKSLRTKDEAEAQDKLARLDKKTTVQWLNAKLNATERSPKEISNKSASDDLDDDLGQLVIDRDQLKTANQLLFPVSSKMQDVLDRQTKTSEYVFTTPRYASCQKKLARLCEKHYDRNVSFRDLRKTFATLMAKKGTPPHLLRELLGHKSIEMTLQYYVEADIQGMAKWLK